MKHRKAKRKLTNKQATTIIISVLCAAALLIGLLVVIGPILGGNADPHAGHNHGSDLGDGHYEGDGHDHGSSNTTAAIANAKVKYQMYKNADGTYRLAFRDSAGKVVTEFNNIAKQPMKETVDADKGVYSLGWASGSGPNDFYYVYYNEKTGQVSDQFHAPRGTDGTRVAYGSEDQTKVIVQDLFSKSAYYKEYTLNAPSTTANNIIMSGKLQSDKKTVVISYVDTDGKTRHANFKLYE